MAFADVLLHETEADLVIVDRHHKPGGHWNLAYPFVTLHQPSAFYGVSSRELSKGRIDTVGLNAGLHELATGAEVSAYFDDVMRHQFLPSGRVRYFPMCMAHGLDSAGSVVECRPIIGGGTFRVHAQKLVDATFLKTSVPANHTPNFEVDKNVWFAPLNDLPRLNKAPHGYVVIGGGKTGIDACLWLLQSGADPDTIRWIVPRDGWLLDRKNAQPTPEFFEDTFGALARQMEAIATSESIPDLFSRLEKAGLLLRLDPHVTPKMFHGATVTQAELQELHRIKNVIRMGRIQRLSEDEVQLEQGALPTSSEILHVDCSARAIANTETCPIFAGNRITPQMLRSYQPVFSAAFAAHVEATFSDDKTKNRLCGVVPVPNHDTDWIRCNAAAMLNQAQWSQDQDLRDWLRDNRLDGFSQLIRTADRNNKSHQDILTRLKTQTMPAMARLLEYTAQLAQGEQAATQ